MLAPPARRRPDVLRRRSATRSARRALATIAALTAITVLGQAAAATADTARLSSWNPASGYTGYAIVITASDGTQRTLGRYDFGTTMLMLRISPDRRHIAAVPYAPERLNRIWIVPMDGGPARALTTDPSVRATTDRTGVWWTSDSRELIIDDTMQVGSRKQHHPYRSRVLRCSLASNSCPVIPGVDGVAATVPGGIVTSSSIGSLLPYDPGSVAVDLGWRVVERDPAKLRRFQVERRVSTALITDVPRTLTSTTSSLATGIDGAFAAVGGPSGALIVHRLLHTPITRARRGHVVRWRAGEIRWTLVDPSGNRHTIAAPRLRIPTALAEATPENARRQTQLAYVAPKSPLPTGGWLAEVQSLHEAGISGLALAIVRADGAASLVRTDGRIVSASGLIRTVLGRRTPRGSASLSVVGHEAATDSAVVGLGWPEERGDELRHRSATVRVPLDGRTPPTVVSRTTEQVAW